MSRLLLLCGAALIVSAAPKPPVVTSPTVPTKVLVAGDDTIRPASLKLAQEGAAALAKGQAPAALDAYEAAVAVDPKNRDAFIGMARASQAMGLPGKAVKFYREALMLEPNDLTALAGQGEALAQRGARARAQVNLARLKELCGACAQATQLAATIARTPVLPLQVADATKPADAAKPPLKN